MEHGATHAEHGGGLNRLAVSATTHCLTGCAIGEVSGMALATALGWGNLAQIALAVALAYFFGFSLTCDAANPGRAHGRDDRLHRSRR